MGKVLDGGFLFGGHPTIADFAAHHGAWYIRDLAELELIKDYPSVLAQLARRSLSKLLDLDVQTIYFAHGEPVLEGGKAKIRSLVERLNVV